MKSLTKQLLAAYVCWVMLHLIFLVEGHNFFGDVEMNHYLGVVKKEFWPEEDIDCYDITEFVIYTIMPVAIYWVIRLIKESFLEK